MKQFDELRSNMVRQERLHELFDYSLITGLLYTRVPRGRWQTIQVGSPIYCRRLYGPNGDYRYDRLLVDGRGELFHRVIWKWVTGEDPDLLIDHQDRDVCNNAWHNLRLATHSQNAMNKNKQHNNGSGFKGVYWEPNRAKYVAAVVLEGKKHFLGRFNTAEEASRAYELRSAELHGEFARNDKN